MKQRKCQSIKYDYNDRHYTLQTTHKHPSIDDSMKTRASAAAAAGVATKTVASKTLTTPKAIINLNKQKRSDYFQYKSGTQWAFNQPWLCMQSIHPSNQPAMPGVKQTFVYTSTKVSVHWRSNHPYVHPSPCPRTTIHPSIHPSTSQGIHLCSGSWQVIVYLKCSSVCLSVCYRFIRVHLLGGRTD